jgi:hypothetical protein
MGLLPVICGRVPLSKALFTCLMGTVTEKRDEVLGQQVGLLVCGKMPAARHLRPSMEVEPPLAPASGRWADIFLERSQLLQEPTARRLDPASHRRVRLRSSIDLPSLSSR